jgi:hypothetical protein
VVGLLAQAARLAAALGVPGGQAGTQSQVDRWHRGASLDMKGCMSDTVVSGPIWTNLVPIRNEIFFFKNISYGQIRAFRYTLLN